MKIEIKRWVNNSVLFADDCPNNSLLKTLEKAVKNGADLDGANLVGADLDGADLDGANLVGANLVGADLVGANLEGARLDRADLEGANLEGARLVGARLVGADLVGADLEGARLEGADLWGAIIRTTLNHKRGSGEEKALKKLAEYISKENVERWKIQGKFIEDDAIFLFNELVCTPKGTFCIEVRGDCTPTDRVIHRLMLWRHDRGKFYKIAQKQW